VRIACRACLRETEIERPEFACPACGSARIDVVGGREMHLKEILGVRQTADGGRHKKRSKSSSTSQTPNPK
jgi:DNA-directed RNA polymerase subunit RPC12/RpoP